MKVNFCMYGSKLDVYEFLLKAKYITENYSLWEFVDVMKDEYPGFTLHFVEDTILSTIPFSFGKFILANRLLLLDKNIVGKGTIKEISVSIDKKELKHYSNYIVYSIHPKFMRLLAELDIMVYISLLN